MGVAAFGVMTFCFAALSWAAEEAPRRPGGGLIPGMGMTRGSSAQMWGFLLQSEQVQKELELVDDQKTKLNEIRDKAMAKMREAFGDREALKNLSAEERKTRFAEAGKKLAAQAEETKKEIEGVLVPQQIGRLNQIALQVRGVAALQDKEVQQALGITSDQMDKMKSIGDASREKFRSAMEGLSGQERRAKFQELRKQVEDEVVGVLTSEQKEKFDKMKGPKFEFDFSALRPRGRPGARPEEKK
jgi:Spy/CpxP family protein refolding chaperone